MDLGLFKMMTVTHITPEQRVVHEGIYGLKKDII